MHLFERWRACQVSALFLFFLIYLHFWKDITMYKYSPHLRGEHLCSTSTRREHLQNYLKFFCMEFYLFFQLTYVFNHLFMYSIIYLCKCGLILWVIIHCHYILLLKLFHLWPKGAIQWVPVSLWHTLIMVVFVYFRTFRLYMMLQAHLVYDFLHH